MKNLKKYDIVYDKAVLEWDEAPALGCGKLGSLIYGDGPIRVTVDRTDLWDNRPNLSVLDEAFNFPNLVKLSTGSEEDWCGERKRLFGGSMNDTPYPTKLTAGRLLIDFGTKTDNIKSRVSLNTATGNFVIGDEKVGNVEAFLSATEFVGVLKVTGSYTLDIRVPTYLSDKNTLGYPEAKITREGEYIYCRQSTMTDYAFGIVALTKKRDGYDEIYYTVATTDDGKDYIEAGKRELERCAEIGYDELKRRHEEWWKKYWEKSEITLGDALFEKTYYRSYYLFASCSREGFPPMALQGVWTADNDRLPPWKGDYHHDTNTQLSYQSFLKGNRMDEGRAFVDYIWSLRDTFRGFAKSFFKVDGLLLPGTTTFDGTAICGWAQYSFTPTMTIWVAQSFDEYWLYTADKSFLRTRAYPFFKEVGKAIYALLEEKDGKLYLPLSTSPEIYDNTREAYLEPNSNFDLALLIYLFKTLKGYCEILGKDASFYQGVLDRLDPIAINESHMIMLDKKRNLHISHRHLSHVMCLYPLHLINYDDDPTNRLIYERTMLHLERLGTGWWIGFSFGMAAQVYAMMHNGGAAYEKLRAFCKGFVADNGFHLNGDFKNYGICQWHYRPFTLESLFGYCDALQEMLLQEHNGYIEVFPAIPEEWEKAVSFKNLRSYGGVLVSAEYKNGLTAGITLRSSRKQTVKVKNTFGTDTLVIKTGKETRTVTVGVGEVFTLELTAKTKITPFFG